MTMLKITRAEIMSRYSRFDHIIALWRAMLFCRELAFQRWDEDDPLSRISLITAWRAAWSIHHDTAYLNGLRRALKKRGYDYIPYDCRWEARP